MRKPKLSAQGSTSVDPVSSLPVTLDRLHALINEQGLQRSNVCDVKRLAARTALPEGIVRHLLAGGEPSVGTVNDRSAHA